MILLYSANTSGLIESITGIYLPVCINATVLCQSRDVERQEHYVRTRAPADHDDDYVVAPEGLSDAQVGGGLRRLPCPLARPRQLGVPPTDPSLRLLSARNRHGRPADFDLLVTH